MKHAMQPNQKSTISSVVDGERCNWLPPHVQGDQANFSKREDEAYRLFNERFLIRQKSPRAGRDDLFQKIVVRSREAAARYQPRRPFGPWIFTIAAKFISNSPRWSLVPLDAVTEHGVALNAHTDERLERHAIVLWLERETTRLPRVHVKLRVLASKVDGTRQSDIANVLDIPLNTVKTRLHRANQNLSDAPSQCETRRKTGTRE